jgi:N-acetylglucosamine kinase-like BadF-type ATPase
MIALIVDGGGTKTKAWLAQREGRNCLKTIETGASNIGQVGESGLQTVFGELLAEIPQELRPGIVLAGLAGVGREPERLKALKAARTTFPDAEVRVVTDAELAYSAAFADGRHGILIIVGTGTIACFRTQIGHEFIRVGGWGPILGDEGGGAWIGREALRHCLLEWERDELSPLHASVLRELQIDTAMQIITKVYLEHFGPRDWGKLAPLVFECAREDQGALRIVRSAAVELVGLAERIVEKQLPDANEVPLVVTGGIWHHRELLQPLMEEEIALRNLSLMFQEPAAGPMEGGLMLLENKK